jgi:hypothetical protein
MSVGSLQAMKATLLATLKSLNNVEEEHAYKIMESRKEFSPHSSILSRNRYQLAQLAKEEEALHALPVLHENRRQELALEARTYSRCRIPIFNKRTPMTLCTLIAV